jgi:hypothetical protein
MATDARSELCRRPVLPRARFDVVLRSDSSTEGFDVQSDYGSTQHDAGECAGDYADAERDR